MAERSSNDNTVASVVYIEPFRNFKYRVEIDGMEVLGFSKMSQLENETKIETYEEGGVNGRTHNFPSTTSYSNIVLEHGVCEDNLIYDWREEVISGDVMNALKSGTIKLYDGDGEYLEMWTFHGAWPVKLTISELDTSASGVLIESVELAIDFFERV